MSLEFPKEYIISAKPGEKIISHSGVPLDFAYDVKFMITNRGWMHRIISDIPPAPSYVGIETAGAIIASHADHINGSLCAMIKDGELKGKLHPNGNIIVIDDVVTTGGSFKEARNILLHKYGVLDSRIEYFAVVDRRNLNERDLIVKSMFDIPEGR